MSNKIKFKKSIIISLITTIIFSVFLAISNIYEYKEYTQNFNKRIASIIELIQSKYPEISTDEIVKIVNSKKIPQNDLLKKYGIDLEKNSIVLDNNKTNNKFIKIEISIIFIGLIILLLIFVIYERHQGKEIYEITKYLEAINNKNYTLKIDENSEEELSILKNELYKVTVMKRQNKSKNSIRRYITSIKNTTNINFNNIR